MVMNYRLAFLSFFLLLFIFSMGCLETSTPLAQKKAILQKQVSSDTDGDGLPDVWKYTFSQQSEGNLYISKEIVVKGMEKDPAFVLQPKYKRDESYASTYYDLLTNLATITLNCNYALGDVIPVCSNEGECLALCTANVRCNNGLNKYPQLNGTLYPTAVEFNLVKKKAADLRTTIASTSKPTQAELDAILLQRDDLNNAISKLMSSKAFDLGICSQNEFMVAAGQLKHLSEIYLIDDEATTESYFEAYKTYEITSKTSYTYDENAIVTVDEIIPESFATRKSSLSFLTVSPIYVSDSTPLTVRYKLNFKKLSDTKADFGYKVTAPAANWNSEMQKVTYPAGTISILSLENISVYVQLRDTFTLIFALFHAYMGFGFAFALTLFLFLILIYLIYTLVRLAHSVIVSARRHEPLTEAVYRIAGYGGRGKMEYIAAAIITLALGSYLIITAGEPVSADLIQALSANTTLLIGSLIFLLGLILLSFIVEDEIKSRVLGERYLRAPVEQGIRKVLVEKEMRAEIQKMRTDIMSLKESASVAGIIFDSARLDRFFADLSAAETKISRGELEDAELMLEKTLRKEYAALHELLAVGMDQEKILEKMRDEVSDEIDQLESLYRKLANYGVKFEKKDWRVEANRYSIIYSGQGFAAAKKYLDSIMESIRSERSSIQNKMADIEHLMLTKFPCPVCGRMTSLASDRCESCGVSLEEGFTNKRNELKQELDSLGAELKAKKITRGDRLVASVDTLLAHMAENISAKQYDKASELVKTIDEKLKYIQEILGRTISQESELKAHLAEIDKHLEAIPALIAQAHENSIDISSIEKRFAAFGGKEALAEVSALPLEEAVTRSKELAESYAQIESDIKNTIAKFMVSVSAFERVNELFTEVSTLITRAKGYGMATEEYSKRLGGLNVNSLIEDIEKNEVDEKELANTVNILSDLAVELKRKVSFAQQFTEQLNIIEGKLKEAGTLVEVCKKNNLVPFEEMERLYNISTIPLRDRIESFGLDEVDSIRNDIVALETKVDSILLTLRRKSEVLSAWPGWKSFIEGLLRRQDRVDPSMLSNIPPEWRPWVVERFVSETDLPVALEGNTIVMLKSIKEVSKADLEHILDEMISTQRIIGGIILRKDGLVISSKLPVGGDAESVAAAAAMAMQKAEGASTALNKGDVNYVVFNAQHGRQVLTRAGEQSLILAIIKPDEDLGFVLLTMKKAADKVRDTIDKL